MGEVVTIVEIDMTNGHYHHTACLCTQNGLRTIVCQSV